MADARPGVPSNSHATPMHAPNPMGAQAFPLLMLDVSNGASNPPRLGFKKMHWHDDLQFVTVTSGTAGIDCAGAHFSCTEGQGVLFNSGAVHRIMGDTATKYTSFVFPTKMLGFFSGSDMHAFGVAPFVGPDAQPFVHLDLHSKWHFEVLDQLRAAHGILVGGNASGVERYRACTHLLNAWAAYVENAERRPPTKAQREANERIKAFTVFVDGHFSEDIRLNDIARAGNVSKTECTRCFKRMLQTTPHAYVLDYRIDKAIELMQDTELTIAGIARSVGFGSPSHFSTTFKKSLGMSPRDYMDALRGETTTAPTHTNDARRGRTS